MDFGLQASGLETIFANDVSSDCIKTLDRHFSAADLHKGPASTIGSFPDADIVVGGYPCQSFSLGGKRRPDLDSRSELYLEFARCIDKVRPFFFIAENVSGLRSVGSGEYLRRQLRAFSDAGTGYDVSHAILKAEEYGIPQRRRRLFIIGVRKDLGLHYVFPEPTHGKGRLEFISHGSVISDLPLWPEGEFYELGGDPSRSFSWYYMSRNRKADWQSPSFTIVANWRHVTLHPGSPRMIKISSDLKNGFKQVWAFADDYDLPAEKFRLPRPRRLSWREAARIQTFPDWFHPCGNVQSIFSQIGNAVPPKLFEILVRGIVTGSSLVRSSRFPQCAAA
ncbi:MAG: hypothetical protein RLY86_1942 [Pseudomonadota bacterium]